MSVRNVMGAEISTDAVAGSNGDTVAARRYTGPIIDCDVHQAWADEGEIRRRLPAYFQQPWAGLPSSPWPSPTGVLRSDAVPEEGGPAGSSPALMAEQLLDAYGIVRAILTGQSVLTAGVHADADFGCALASAYNDALLETWLSADDRFLGSLAVAPQRPRQAAAEIRRVGAHPRMVQVIMTSAPASRTATASTGRSTRRHATWDCRSPFIPGPSARASPTPMPPACPRVTSTGIPTSRRTSWAS